MFLYAESLRESQQNLIRIEKYKTPHGALAGVKLGLPQSHNLLTLINQNIN